MLVELPEFSSHMFPMHILLVCSDREWSQLVGHLGTKRARPSNPASVSVFQCDGRHDVVVVNINDAVNDCAFTDRIALYAHECVHVAQHAAKCIGQRLGAEVEAYFVQALLLWVIGECEDWE